MSFQTHEVPNLIQGVSQQAPQQRRDTQAEEQFDCINSPVYGAVARPGFDLVATYAADWEGAFCYEIFRGSSEHYLLVGLDEDLKVLNLATGVEAAVTFENDDKSYLNVTGSPRDKMVAVTIDDFTFLANRDINPAMSSTKSPPAVNEAIVHFRAGHYSTTYQLALRTKSLGGEGQEAAPDTTGGNGVTIFDLDYALDNDKIVADFGIYLPAAAAAVKFKIAQRTSANTYTIFYEQTVSHPGGGWAYFRATTPYTVPASGDFYAGVYAAENGGGDTLVSGKDRAAFTGDATGVGVTFVESESNVYRTWAYYEGTASKVYTWTYKTPDNSTSGNADYIATNQLAATFFRALTDGAAVPTTSGGDDSGAQPGVGAGGTGHDTGVVGDIDAVALGFGVAINGSTLRIYRLDGSPFKVSTGDGAGNTHFIGIKGEVQSFGELPKACFDGTIIKVAGESRTGDDDYYVKYTEDGNGAGIWKETVAPNVSVGLDDTTMPRQLVNTGVNAFTFEKAPWGARVAGDEDTATEPSFAGHRIEDLFYDNKRLAILTEGACVWSKARNSYVFFPDTAQTVLATAPVDTQVSATSHVALLRRAVQAGEATMLWAQLAQFRVHSGSESFKQETVDAKQATAYEFVEEAAPKSVGTSLYFATHNGDFATLRDLILTDGKVRGDVDVTEHIPRYVPSGIRGIAASDTSRTLAVRSDGAMDRLYIYNWLLSGNERLQSAWNTWRLPADCKVLWVGILQSTMRALVQRGDAVALIKMDLTPRRTDGGTTKYLTRLDYRITDADMEVGEYDEEADETIITLPYVLTEDDAENYVISVRTSSEDPERPKRAHQFEIVSVDEDEVTVRGDASGLDLFGGFKIVAIRDESDFFLRTKDGSVPAERVQVRDVVVVHSGTGYYRAEIMRPNGKNSKASWEAQTTGVSAADDLAVIGDGQLKVPVNSESGTYKLRLINDTFLPSAWISEQYTYSAKVNSALRQGERRAAR